MKKKRHFITVFAFIELCICLLFAFWYFVRSSELIEDVVKEKLFLAHDIVENKLNQTSSYLAASLDFMGKYINQHANQDNQVTKYLFNLYTEQKKIKELIPLYEIFLVDNNGTFKVGMRDEWNLMVFRHHSEINKLIEKCTATPMEMRFGRLIKLDLAINTVCYGLLDYSGNYAGTLIAGIDRAAFEANMGDAIGDDTVSFAIYDKNKEIIYESRDAFISKQYGKQINEMLLDTERPAETLIKLGKFHIFNPKIIYSYYNLNNKLTYVLTINDKFSAKILTRKMWPLATDLLFLLSIGIIITFFVYRKLVNPVITLSKQAQQIAEGDVNIVPQRYNYHELDSLSKAIIKVAEQRKLQEENQKLHFLVQKAEEANQAKTKFIHHIQHEFRTPLNHILGSAEILSAGMLGSLPEGCQPYINNITQSGKSLLEAINNVIYLADYLSGKVVLKEEICSLKKIISEVIEKFASQAHTLDLEIKQDIQVSLPLIIIDYVQFSEALSYIFDNAIKFNKQNGLVQISAYQQDNRSIILSVKDSGVGIDPDNLAKITEMFNESENHIAKFNKGIGLGLSVADCIFNLHGIKLKLESTLGVGTCVTIIIPPHRIKEI
jgi:signal transduction histidine kinase